MPDVARVDGCQQCAPFRFRPLGPIVLADIARGMGSDYSPRTLCASSAAFPAPSFFKRLARWKSTVRGLTPSVRPASLLEAPRVIWASATFFGGQALVPGERLRQDVEGAVQRLIESLLVLAELLPVLGSQPERVSAHPQAIIAPGCERRRAASDFVTVLPRPIGNRANSLPRGSVTEIQAPCQVSSCANSRRSVSRFRSQGAGILPFADMLEGAPIRNYEVIVFHRPPRSSVSARGNLGRSKR